ncbi:MAG TPA: PEP/pyruvate-binding domain-containing protein, partial [Planctomycetota bacterium]|nr:PEP/pyruvate-binding domain-containing protein [Planctomycetota bacterium]
MKHVIFAGDATTPDVVGWKAARQALLGNAGLPVPRFFSLGRDAFDGWLAPVAAELRARLAAVELDRGDAPLASIREWLAGRELPGDVRRELAEALASSFEPEAPLAVRGCFVGGVGEDSESDPFAGASESFLDVPRAEVEEHVRRVFASVVSLPALLYRRARGMDVLAHSVSVMVQALVRAEASFVAFTRDPSSGAQEIVVAAARGSGEGVVQERADIDHFHLAPEGKLLRSELAGDLPVLEERAL